MANTGHERSLRFLAQQQLPGGLFPVLESRHRYDFQAAKAHPTTFLTALITGILAPLGLDGWAGPQERAVAFLYRQLSRDWSVNYWDRDSWEASTVPYPDDLDDTFVTASALQLAAPDLVDGEAVGRLARLLTSSETTIGGPYRTWLVRPDAAPAWHDTDLAVNANIGYFLSLQGVELPALSAMLETAMAGAGPVSRYYVGGLPVVYFWSRFYKGVASGRLRAWIRMRLTEPATLSDPLAAALSVTTGLNLGIDRQELEPAAQAVRKARQADGGWPASGLYYDLIEGERFYAGSPALTTALCIEALLRLDPPVARIGSGAQPLVARGPFLQSAIERSEQLPSELLRSRFIAAVERTLDHDRDSQICGLPVITAAALGREVHQHVAHELGLASMYGWIAYTIYDNFLDDEGDPGLIGVANVAAREMWRLFYEALPADSRFIELVDQALDRIEAANTWEVSYARAEVSDGVLRVAALPEYTDYTQLAERSIGHSLAAVGTALAAGYQLDSVVVNRLRQFFYHYLIARQLNDDAHDWEHDLRRGQLNAVACLCLGAGLNRRQNIRLSLEEELPVLQQWFWRDGIGRVCRLIYHHAEAARQALRADAVIPHPAALETLLLPLVHSADEALGEQRRTLGFIRRYDGTP